MNFPSDNPSVLPPQASAYRGAGARSRVAAKEAPTSPVAVARLPAHRVTPGLARRFVTNVLQDSPCEALADDLAPLTSEVVTNAILHAGTDIEVCVHLTDDGGVRVSVADGDPAPPQRRDVVVSSTGGRGLAIVAALARCWGVDNVDFGKSVWFELGSPYASGGYESRANESTGKGAPMSKLDNAADDAKGRMKEAAGDLSGDRHLEREGKLDRAQATAKEKLDAAKDKIEDAVGSLKEKFDR